MPPGRYAYPEPPALAVPPLTTYREGRLIIIRTFYPACVGNQCQGPASIGGDNASDRLDGGGHGSK